MNPDDRDVDALLRSDIDPLPPPPGSWDTVRRRARHRRWAKFGMSVAAVVVVAAGAVPAVLAVRAHQDDRQQLSVSTVTPDRTAATPTTAAVDPLAGFKPTAVSFVSPTDGFLFGFNGSDASALVTTRDGGRTWTPLTTPRVNASAASMRFADPNIGFVFGKRYYVTSDGGQRWSRQPSPGRIVDLETMNGKVWALVRPPGDPGTVILYSASLADPTLAPVEAVPPMADPVSNGDSIAVIGSAVDIVGGATQFWSTRDGDRWKHGTSPCSPQSQSARVAAWGDTGVVLACGVHSVAGSETKQLFESTDGGRSWTAMASRPDPAGLLATLGAGTATNVVVGTTGGVGQVTRDGGSSWQTPSTYGVPLGFAGFIDSEHIVALADRGDTDTGAFLTSDDAGRTWSVTRFPN